VSTAPPPRRTLPTSVAIGVARGAAGTACCGADSAVRYLSSNREKVKTMQVMKNRESLAAFEHDRWFRAQAQSTLDRMARGEEKLIPHDKLWDSIVSEARDLVIKREAAKGKASATSP